MEGPPRVDFDIYLNEALMPVLAQSLDALCRQMSRMDSQGEALDPKVRERFNPLTFLAQQLLRRHPKCARTPRRQELYSDFHKWADHEHGRREMLSRKADVMDVFSGFVLRGVVQMEDVPNVLKAIDDTMHLEGHLKDHKTLAKDFGVKARLSSKEAADTGGMRTPRGGPPGAPAGPSKDLLASTVSAKTLATDRAARAGKAGPNPRARASFFDKSSGITWAKFWSTFSSILMSSEVVPYSVLERGDRLKKEELEERTRRVEAEAKLVEAQAQREVEYQQQMTAYEELHVRLKACEGLTAILQDNKILTGDDVRPKDAGYEFEVAPKGVHVQQLEELMVLFGLMEAKEQNGDESWWTADKANAWTILQEMHHAELADGVVERETLEKVLVPPTGFMSLKLKIADELERRAEAKGEMEHLLMDDMRRVPSSNPLGKKPSLEQLSDRLGMSLSRIEWLHQLFESYMDPDPENPDELPEDTYPDNPGFINKVKMKELILEVQPDLGEHEFDARFQRIDQDCSGRVEFDEFVTWIHADEVRVVGGSNKKMTFEELAAAHDEALEVIMYLYNCFQDALPEGAVDQYPDAPEGLNKDELKDLIMILTPNVSADDAYQGFDSVDVDGKERLDFDEFLEVLNMDELPQELREKYSG